MIRITISMVAGSSPANLEKCLSTMAKSTGDFKISVVVVDNMSEWSVEPLVRRCFHDAVVLRNDSRFGFGKNHNIAQFGRDDDFALVANDDIEFKPDTIAMMLNTATSHPDAAIIGPLIHPKSWDSPPMMPGSGLCEFLPKPIYGLIALYLKALGLGGLLSGAIRTKSGAASEPGEEKLSYVSGACCMVRRDFIKEHGLYDEAFFMYYEDIDLGRRAVESGWECRVSPKARIMHLEGGSSSPATLGMMAGSLLRFTEKHHGSIAAFFIRLALLPLKPLTSRSGRGK